MCDSADRNEEKDMAMTLVGVPFFPLFDRLTEGSSKRCVYRQTQTKINKNFPKTNNLSLSVSDTHAIPSTQASPVI